MWKFENSKSFLTIGASVFALMTSQTAHAQEEQLDSADDGNVIIVTATQRASDVQDIPIAVTAVTPVQLERQGIIDIKSLKSVAAGFSVGSTQNESQGTSIRIRGIGTAGNNIGLESAVGVFIDGAYQSRPGVALGELVDVQQVEVLRGPQGTLFGRNTTAGALVVRNKKPELDSFGGFASASYGNFDLINLQGAVNAPLVEDQLAVRLTGAYRKQDGFVISAADGSESHDKDRFLIRGQLLWEPNIDVSLRLIADYQETNEACCGSVILIAPPTLPPGIAGRLFPSGTAAPGFPLPPPGSEFPFDVPLVTDDVELNNSIEQWGISGEFTWSFDAAELTVIGSYRDFTGGGFGNDGTALSTFTLGNGGPTSLPGAPPFRDDIVTYTGEARLQGSAFDDVLDWLVGVYYSNETIDERFGGNLGGDFDEVVGTAFGDPTALLAFSSVGNLLAGDGTFTPVSTGGAFADNFFQQEGESFSVFTHNIINFTDSLSLTLGARYVDDSKDGSFTQLSAANPACINNLNALDLLNGGAGAAAQAAAQADLLAAVGGNAAAATGLTGGLAAAAPFYCFAFASPVLSDPRVPASAAGVAPEEFAETFSDEEFIYTIQASWKPSLDILTYASFTHGYKAGGFNLDPNAAVGVADPRFLSEEVDAYEIGIKSTLFDGAVRANVAFFLNELSDFQVLDFTGIGFETFNVQDVSSTGVEVEVFGQLSDYISTNIAVNYTDAKFGSDCAVGATNPAAASVCGVALSNSPEWVGVFGATYDGPIVSDWAMLANINLRYESDRRAGLAAPVLFDIQDAHLKVNARIGFTEPNERFTIEFWGQNLTNEITASFVANTAFVPGGQTAFPEAPRTYGVTLRSKF